MPKTVLVPLDGSELAARALPYARSLAHHLECRIILVHAVLPGLTSADQHGTAEEIQAARSELARVASEFRATGAEVDWLIPEDEAGWAIISTAQAQGAELIVMSTHGRTGLGRWLFGSIADRVLHQAPAPVLLVPPAVTFNWPSDRTGLRIVVPLDGSALAEEAIAPAAELAQATQGELILTRAVVLPGAPGANAPADPTAATEQALRSLEPIEARLHARGIHFRPHVAPGIPHEVILGAVREHYAHLIAMTTHGRTGLRRLLLGSVADAVLRQTHVALLLVRGATPSVDVISPPLL